LDNNSNRIRSSSTEESLRSSRRDVRDVRKSIREDDLSLATRARANSEADVETNIRSHTEVKARYQKRRSIDAPFSNLVIEGALSMSSPLKFLPKTVESQEEPSITEKVVKERSSRSFSQSKEEDTKFPPTPKRSNSNSKLELRKSYPINDSKFSRSADVLPRGDEPNDEKDISSETKPSNNREIEPKQEKSTPGGGFEKPSKSSKETPKGDEKPPQSSSRDLTRGKSDEKPQSSSLDLTKGEKKL